jgi:hypothetical protein
LSSGKIEDEFDYNRKNRVGQGTVLVLLVAFLLGGVYTITPPSGPVDTAYK